jgi:hypothetical protein
VLAVGWNSTEPDGLRLAILTQLAIDMMESSQQDSKELLDLEVPD